VATVEECAKRRYKQLKKKGIGAKLPDLITALSGQHRRRQARRCNLCLVSLLSIHFQFKRPCVINEIMRLIESQGIW
jgi:cytidylate kinase